ncbi:AAA family ATPase [Zymobacter palmae]|uniref:Chromosome segregation ATPases n=1 Tax=Zymobacter palmae TaxID=33074 RepID=A0A348HHS5_9GAMM|nr:hypothetical protein [Zymobacter palmae]BBG31177.1 chromosome segregation ATPases [Zymobacter palmae]
MINIVIKNIFVYSFSTEKVFDAEFGRSVNIIYGKNTSGKSTLIQSILYSMGVNDSKENLNDIIEEDALFRLEVDHEKDGVHKSVIFVRHDNSLIISVCGEISYKFNGINANNSKEHIKYKDIFSNIFGFNMMLQNKNELVKAPVEAAFLPFYISQSVGWVYLKESIGDYRFYKDFNCDYVDYYMGVDGSNNNIERYSLEKEKDVLNKKIRFLSTYKEEDSSILLSEKIDSRFKGETNKFLEHFKENSEGLSDLEVKYSDCCNEMAEVNERKKIIYKIIRNIKLQRPELDKCNVCGQFLPSGIESLYFYYQDINDALTQKKIIGEEIKKLQSKINSISEKINTKNKDNAKNYNLLIDSSVDDISFKDWLEYKSSIALKDEINRRIMLAEDELSVINDKLKLITGDNSVVRKRKEVEKSFLKIFLSKASSLDVTVPKQDKYRDLYAISSFPYQGVELHKIIMAYHFAFYKMVTSIKKNHQFPFILDAVFKEDIDYYNRELILKFLGEESKSTGQMIFSLAECKDDDFHDHSELFDVKKIDKKYFDEKSSKICIGDSKNTRAFLLKRNLSEKEIYKLQDSLKKLDII